MATITLGTNLKQLRQQQHLTQTTLAEQLHVSRQTISSWENDRNQPDLATLQTLATFYHRSLDELLTGGTPATPTFEPTINRWAVLVLAILAVERITQLSPASGRLWMDFMMASLLLIMAGITGARRHHLIHTNMLTVLIYAAWGTLAFVSGTFNWANMGFGFMTTCQISGLIILIKTSLSYRQYRRIR
ncbi:helix-turn-helix domain-containing protein [Lactiplantibacillus fabifermentans]|nr:helix-turn-helix transcriptional regulator [Lactiplantibacillus fabifermentans]ETY74681.1 hypothetical protein LFAB_05855 [Lactiplantibacillus fabifermentans T30PCM01]